jgi:hypothetical protein
MLEGAANYIERWIGWQRQHTANAYVIGKRSNRLQGFDDLTRARTRALAEVARRMFEGPLNTAIARIATAASNGPKKITARDVINWTSQGAN